MEKTKMEKNRVDHSQLVRFTQAALVSAYPDLRIAGELLQDKTEECTRLRRHVARSEYQQKTIGATIMGGADGVFIGALEVEVVCCKFCGAIALNVEDVKHEHACPAYRF